MNGSSATAGTSSVVDASTVKTDGDSQTTSGDDTGARSGTSSRTALTISRHPIP
jgi:hypothetical protein